MAAHLRLDLAGRPHAASLAQPEVGKLLHRPVFQRLLHIHRKANAVIEPTLDLGVVRSLGSTGRTLQNIAIARAKLRFSKRRLPGPEILRLEKILVAEIRPQQPLAPLLEGQGKSLFVAGMHDLN